MLKPKVWMNVRLKKAPLYWSSNIKFTNDQNHFIMIEGGIMNFM